MTLDVAIRRQAGAFQLDVAFQAGLPQTVVLFGPSGCGKTTVVNAIAGLVVPDSGRIAVGDATLYDGARGVSVPPERRSVGVVFQDARLFPHMSVATNLRYGARRATSRRIGFDDVVDLLGIASLLRRTPRDLSGGERQRVAIGRALLAQPRLLLMDEPLASLDVARKQEILPYLMRLKSSLDLPIVYVTHALDEVARLADILVLLDQGRVLAYGPVGEMAARSDLPLAARDDAAAILPMRVASHDAERHLSLLEAGELRLWVPQVHAEIGASLRAMIPAREVILATAVPAEISVQNVVACTVRAVRADPARLAATIELSVGPVALLARVTPDAVHRLSLEPGRPALALIKSMSIDVLALR